MPTPSRSPRRSLLAALALLGAAGLSACELAPEGRCETDGDCTAGRHCAEAVCVPDGRSDLYGGCVVDLDCDPYAECTRGACVLRHGRCAMPVDCAAWESCEQTVCTPLPGRCGTLEDCAAWEICIAAASTSPALPEHRCAVAPGRCIAAGDCAGWQQCDVAAKLCETAPGYCSSSAECAPWEACGTTDHLCALRAGACVVQDDCPPDRICQANACVAQPAPPVLDPGAVHLVGTVEPGTPGRGAIAPVGSPQSKLVGLADGDAACGARLDAGGSVVVSRASALATLVPDAIVWDAAADLWVYPADPAANDAAVALPAGCASAAAVVLQAGTGARLVDCGAPGAPEWRDVDGALVTTVPLLAWNADGLMLAGTVGMVVPPVLLDATGATVTVTGLPVDAMSGLPYQLLAGWRASAAGFSLVLTAGAAAQLADLEVWAVDATGAATLVGALPSLPAAVTEADPPVLDAAGDVFQLGRTAGGDVVVQRTPGGAATVVHDEATLPPPGGATLLEERVHAVGACLLTGP